jgi:hypothetical protein
MSSGRVRTTDDGVPMNPFQRSDAPTAPSQSTAPFPAIGNPVFAPSADDAQTNEPWYSRSPKLFTIMGVAVHVSPVLYVYIGITLLFGALTASFYVFALQAFAGALLFGTVLVHELGHCAAARGRRRGESYFALAARWVSVRERGGDGCEGRLFRLVCRAVDALADARGMGGDFCYDNGRHRHSSFTE